MSPVTSSRSSDAGNLCVLGAQWGDEGKGKIVDLLTPHFSIVARYQGGHNAGHTVFVKEQKYVLHLIPSGILHPQVTCVMGNGMVIDPVALLKEIDELQELEIDVTGRLLISDKAHVILPYHSTRDIHSEELLGERKVGTTGRGIGPAYEDKIARRGIRIGDLADLSTGGKVHETLKANLKLLEKLTGKKMNSRKLLESLKEVWERLQPFVMDTSFYLHRTMKEELRVMFEGAQGTLLDIDHGTYPFVTSSNATAGGAATGLGIPPQKVGTVLGVAKAYTTRVGQGPLPTELDNDIGKRMRDVGQEFGASTGRPRRCGWFDAVAVRYAVRINGFDALAITKLDVLDGFEEIRVCTKYRCGDEIITEMPTDVATLARCEPVYECVPGWKKPTKGVRDFYGLPDEARGYIKQLESWVGVQAKVITNGQEREDQIVRHDVRIPALAWMHEEPVLK